MHSDDELKGLAQKMGLSYWLRDALLSSLVRDPVDAANDAEILAEILNKRAAQILVNSEAAIGLEKGAGEW